MDFSSLLQALEFSSKPCGDDMTFSMEFDAIQEARRFDDPTLSQGEWITEVKEADWWGVTRLCLELLVTRTKDLRVAGWLTEAKGKVDGLVGLAEGYELLAALCEKWWDEIHPLPEADGDLELRAGAFDWLLARTAHLLHEIPLSRSPKGRFSLLDLESARAAAKNTERNSQESDGTLSTSKVTLEYFEAAIRDTPRQYFMDSMRDVERLNTAMTELQILLNPRMGAFRPSFGTSVDVLDDLSRCFRRYAGSEEGGGPNASAKGGSAGGDGGLGLMPSAVEQSMNMDVLTICSREQAIHQLELIAAFFRRTEPHSPVAYLADKAAKWGGMPLHEWLRSVVKDGSALSRVEELLGVEDGSEFISD